MKNFFYVVPLLFIATFAFGADAAQATTDFSTEVLKAIYGFGGMSWAARVAAIVALVIGSMKVTIFDDLVWNKLGSAKAWLAPVLGLVGGFVALGSSGQFTLAGVVAYASAGAGAILLSELLEIVKTLPGIGPVWVSLISAVEGALGGNPSNTNKPVA